MRPYKDNIVQYSLLVATHNLHKLLFAIRKNRQHFDERLYCFFHFFDS